MIDKVREIQPGFRELVKYLNTFPDLSLLEMHDRGRVIIVTTPRGDVLPIKIHIQRSCFHIWFNGVTVATGTLNVSIPFPERFVDFWWEVPQPYPV